MLQSELDLLVMSTKRGNQAAFNALINHFHRPLTHYALKLCGDPELAKDAVQETWISTAKQIRKLNDPKAFRCWLYKTLKWRVTDAVRKQPRIESFTYSDATYDDETNDEKSELLKMIAQLPINEQEIVHLFYFCEMKLAEIANLQDVPLGTVKSRLDRARKQLHVIYQR
ncbi:RNA polymerase sigma factor [Agaribacter marinus]|uniref:RNA polymerase sigma factor n=1 Tax=Agaribacter marinus TaxID=1431249 RepID=A0AA37T0T1_9ALTE|nr:sigma-70 family RNA polymerase sigma factor [Agaribacter marinus]GLR69460.1 RNA polymerase sigma factor [Agaribacter marinus]